MSIFQRRHYQKMAEILREAEYKMKPYEWEIMLKIFCKELQADNPNFKPSLFQKAAGYEQ